MWTPLMLTGPFFTLSSDQQWDRVASRGGRWTRAKRRGDARAISRSEDCRSRTRFLIALLLSYMGLEGGTRFWTDGVLGLDE